MSEKEREIEDVLLALKMQEEATSPRMQAASGS